MSRWDTFPGGFPNENAKRSATSVINLPLKGTAAAADGIGKVLETPNDPTPCPVDWLGRRRFSSILRTSTPHT